MYTATTRPNLWLVQRAALWCCNTPHADTHTHTDTQSSVVTCRCCCRCCHRHLLLMHDLHLLLWCQHLAVNAHSCWIERWVHHLFCSSEHAVAWPGEQPSAHILHKVTQLSCVTTRRSSLLS